MTMTALLHILLLISLVYCTEAWSTVPILDRSRRTSHFHVDSVERTVTTTTTTTTSSTTALQSSTKGIYSMPALYDLAFGYRDYEEEVDFLLDTHKRITGKRPATILELAAGPARHCLAALQQADDIESATAIDLSTDMIEYAREIASEELPIDRQEDFYYKCADMRSFSTDTPFDTAWLLLGSLQHLTSNEDVIKCFKSIHTSVQPDGTLILELPHPRETFSMVECTRNGWQVPLEDEDGQESGELKIVWGDDNDTFDPITQVRQFTVDMKVTGPQATGMESVRQVVPMRLFTAQEIQALALCAGWNVVEMFGALQEGVSVNDDDAAFRLVCVLRKVE